MSISYYDSSRGHRCDCPEPYMCTVPFAITKEKKRDTWADRTTCTVGEVCPTSELRSDGQSRRLIPLAGNLFSVDGGYTPGIHKLRKGSRRRGCARMHKAGGLSRLPGTFSQSMVSIRLVSIN